MDDNRFAKAHKDPRFARVVKKKTKLKLDDRFKAILTDDAFATTSAGGKAAAAVDKYGRKNETSKADSKAELKAFYRLDAKDTPSPVLSTPTATAAEVAYASLNRKARGEGSSSDDESSSSSSESEASDDEDVTLHETDAPEAIPMGEATSARVAIQNCDWTRLKAADLFVLCQSFVTSSGSIANVTIYPSEFGTQAMARESREGPALWEDDNDDTSLLPTTTTSSNDEKSSSEEEEDEEDASEDAPTTEQAASSNSLSSDSNGSEEEEEEEEEEDPLGVKQSVTESDGLDLTKLRAYELSRLRYFFAVVTCDSIATATALYAQVEGSEYETSSNHLDMRMIPTEVSFSHLIVKDECRAIPVAYTPSLFITNALQSTDVELSWELDDQQRQEDLSTLKTSWQDMDDQALSAYLASEPSSDEDDATTARLRSVLLGPDSDEGGATSDDDVWTKTSTGEASAGMEMTFLPGDLGSEVLARKSETLRREAETPHETYVRTKNQEKTAARQLKRSTQRALAKEQQQTLRDAKKRKKTALMGGASQEEEDRDDVEEVSRDYNLDEILRANRLAGKKIKGKRAGREAARALKVGGGLQEGFAVDTTDRRFDAVFQPTDASFAIDPTDSRYHKTLGMASIMTERSRKKPTPESAKDSSASTPSESGQDGLKDLVASVKRKWADKGKMASKSKRRTVKALK